MAGSFCFQPNRPFRITVPYLLFKTKQYSRFIHQPLPQRICSLPLLSPFTTTAIPSSLSLINACAQSNIKAAYGKSHDCLHTSWKFLLTVSIQSRRDRSHPYWRPLLELRASLAGHLTPTRSPSNSHGRFQSRIEDREHHHVLEPSFSPVRPSASVSVESCVARPPLCTPFRAGQEATISWTWRDLDNFP